MEYEGGRYGILEKSHRRKGRTLRHFNELALNRANAQIAVSLIARAKQTYHPDHASSGTLVTELNGPPSPALRIIIRRTLGQPSDHVQASTGSATITFPFLGCVVVACIWVKATTRGRRLSLPSSVTSLHDVEAYGTSRGKVSEVDTGKIAVFLLGGFLLLLAVLIEAGAPAFLGPASNVAGGELSRPGLGISYIALLDGVLIYTLAIIVTDFIAPLRAVLGRFQALATFLFALIGLLATVGLLVVAYILLTLMVTLLLALPFGTLVYLAAWGHFATGEGRVLLSLVMSLKLAGILTVIVSSPSLLKNRGFMLLIGSSVGCTFLLGLLHALPPGFLVSITDTLGALIAGSLAAIWMLIFLIGAIPGAAKVLRSLSSSS